MRRKATPRQLAKGKKAIKNKMARRGIHSTEYLEWDTAFKAVKKRCRISNWNKLSHITKEALSEIRTKELKEKHREYIESNKWKNRREEKLEREDYTCEKCGETAEQAHHTTYRHFNSKSKEAEISTLMAVCKECHEKIEGEYEPRKTNSYTGNSDNEEEKFDRLIQFNKRHIEDLERQKKEEDESEEEELSSARRRWFNREIEKLKQENKEAKK